MAKKVNQFKSCGKTQANYWYVKFKEPAPTKENPINCLPIKVDRMKDKKLLSIKIGTESIEVSQGFAPKLLSEVVSVLNKLC